MHKKGQFVALFFSVLLTTTVIAIFSLEYTNLISNQNTNFIVSQTSTSNAVAYNLLQQYTFFQSLYPSSTANNYLTLALSSIDKTFFSSYSLNLTKGVTIGAQSASTKAPEAELINIVNTQSSATSSPFQQMLTVNSKKYAAYENGNLSNVQFSYQNGTIIPSWLESGDIADLNGSYNYLYTASSNIPESSTTSSLTWAVWAQTRQNPTTSFHYLINLAGCNGGIEENNGGVIQVEFRNGTCASYINFTYYPAIGSWNYYVVTWSNATDTLSFYVNGVLLQKDTTRINHESWTTLEIGDWTGSPGGTAFNGSEADVQIYSIAISPTVIASIYAEGPGGAPINTQGLVGWWPLTQNLGDAFSGGPVLTNVGVAFNSAGAASNKTVYWLKLGVLGAKSSMTIDMNMYATSINKFNNKNTGEAPQISPKYGQYDDGATVFNFYDNFSGTTLNSVRWSNTDPAKSYSVNNGLTILNGTSSDIVANTAYTYNAAIAEFDGEFMGSLSTSFNLFGVIVSGQAGIGDGGSAASVQLNSYNGAQCDTSISIPTNTYGIYGVYLNSTSTVAYANYVLLLSSSCDHNTATQISPDFYSRASPVIAIIAKYVRIRAYPPNGVMPTTVFAGLV